MSNTNITMTTRYLTREQAAEYLQLGTRSLDRMASKGQVPYIKFPTEVVRYDIHELDELMRQWTRVNEDEVRKAREDDEFDWGDE